MYKKFSDMIVLFTICCNIQSHLKLDLMLQTKLELVIQAEPFKSFFVAALGQI